MSERRTAMDFVRPVLRMFTDVRDGEETSALLMLANVFLILCAYYFVKPLREGWIAVSGIEGLAKVEIKAYTSFAQGLVLIPVVLWYGRLSERWTRSELITRATLFCMSNMVIFWALQPNFFFENLPLSGIVFYIWVGIFGVFVVSQFWSFAADIYSNERGKRMLPMIAIGATAGAAFGSQITGLLVGSGLVGDQWLLIVALLPLGLSIWISRKVDARETALRQAKETAPSEPEPSTSEQPGDSRSAIGVVFSSGFLIAVATITLLLNWVNTNGENLLFWVLQDLLAEQAAAQGITGPEETLAFVKASTTAFYANFFGIVNWVTLALQAFAASRILKYGGFGVMLMMMPVVALVSYTAMAIVPVLAVVKAMKVAENATDYSINNTARSVLWLPVPSDLIYKGKPTIDSLFTRFGDGLAAMTVLVGVNLMALPKTSFMVINIALVVIWISVSVYVVRGHRKLVEENPESVEGLPAN